MVLQFDEPCYYAKGVRPFVGWYYLMYDFKGKKQSHAAEHVILDAVRDALRKKHCSIKSQDDSSLVFSTPFIHFNWRIFYDMSGGAVSVQSADGMSVVSYRMSLFRTRVKATIFTILMIAMGVMSRDASIILFTVATSLILWWGFMYGVHLWISTGRVSDFFDQVLDDLPPGPPPIPKEQY